MARTDLLAALGHAERGAGAPPGPDTTRCDDDGAIPSSSPPVPIDRAART